MYEELVKRLREIHPEEFGDAWDFAFACQQAMHESADAIEELQAHYCPHMIRNVHDRGDDSLCRVLRTEPPKEE